MHHRAADRDMGLQVSLAHWTVTWRGRFRPGARARPLRRAIQQQLENLVAQRSGRVFGERRDPCPAPPVRSDILTRGNVGYR